MESNVENSSIELKIFSDIDRYLWLKIEWKEQIEIPISEPFMQQMYVWMTKIRIKKVFSWRESVWMGNLPINKTKTLTWDSLEYMEKNI